MAALSRGVNFGTYFFLPLSFQKKAATIRCVHLTTALRQFTFWIPRQTAGRANLQQHEAMSIEMFIAQIVFDNSFVEWDFTGPFSNLTILVYYVSDEN
jgi:hypothetical protein